MTGISPYLIIPFATWVVAQLLKFSIRAYRGTGNWRLLYGSGGMPSAHTAVVIALSLTVGIYDGFMGAPFGIATVIAAVVIYDALGVRRSTGEQGKFLAELGRRVDAGMDAPRLRPGHTPAEVAAGLVLGTICAGAMSLGQWWTEGRLWFQEAPSATEQYVWFGLFLAIALIGAGIFTFLSSRKRRSLEASKQLRMIALWLVQLPGWAGMLLMLAAYEEINTWEWRLWPMVLLGVFVLTHMVLTFTLYPRLIANLREEKITLAQRKERKKLKKKQAKKGKRK